MIPIAVRAIWLLYLRSKWTLLAQLGLERSQVEAEFFSFDQRVSSKILSDAKTEEFVLACPGIIPAVFTLLGMYWQVGGKEELE